MERKKIYPTDLIRSNYWFPLYIEMATDSFLVAHEKYWKYSKMEDIIKKQESIKKDTLICLSFSVFAIEAFLNNYLSACLGEERFKAIDRKSIVDKFKHITKEFFCADLSKENRLLNLLNQAVERRDEIVHSKSFDAMKTVDPNDLFSYWDYQQWKANEPNKANIAIEKRIAKVNKEIQQELSNAYDSLRAVAYLAKFFDRHDANVRAFRSLFILAAKESFEKDQTTVDTNGPKYTLMQNLMQFHEKDYLQLYETIS